MRARAKFASLPVPEFVRLLNDGEIHEFLRSTPSPWMLKPRSQAGAIGGAAAMDIDPIIAPPTRRAGRHA